MRIDSSGRVGIGTDNPNRQLVVNGGTSEGVIQITNDTSGTAVANGFELIHFTNGETQLLNRENGDMRFDTNGTERMRILAGGDVGIGTASPGQTLHVNTASGDVTGRFSATSASGTNSVVGLIAGTSGTAALQFGDSGSSDIGQIRYENSNDSMVFNVNGSNRVTIDSSGNMGIGTASPSQQLHIAGTAGAVALLQAGSDTAASVLQFGDTTSTLGQIRYEHSSDALTFYTNNSERARIDSSGEILINSTTSRTNVANLEPRIQIEGINNDTSTLAIISNNTSDGTAAQVHLCKSSSGTVGSNGAVVNNEVLGRVTFDGSDGTNFVSGADILSTCEANAATNAMTANLRFYTNNGGSGPSERMRITSQGYLMVDSDGQGHHVAVGANAGTSTEIFIGAHSSTGLNGGTTSFKVWSNGNVVNTNNSYGSISDAKLKENIIDASSQWDDIKSVKVRNYNFKEDTGQPTHTQIGVIAQELELVSPRLVTESPDRDTDGNELGTVTKSVNYSVLYMKAVKALQEAMERIETLESKVAALEAN